MVTLLKEFPELEKANEVRTILKENITKENIELEVVYFQQKLNTSYERTYGWAWLLKLAEELLDKEVVLKSDLIKLIGLRPFDVTKADERQKKESEDKIAKFLSEDTADDKISDAKE